MINDHMGQAPKTDKKKKIIKFNYRNNKIAWAFISSIFPYHVSFPWGGKLSNKSSF